MQICTEPTTTRINPAELRYTRTALAECTVGCRYQSLQAIVAFAWLHDGLDLSDEATYIKAEWEHMDAAANTLHLSAASYR